MARATVIICSFNIAVVICVFHNLYSYRYQDSHNVVSYTPDEIRNMEESARIRVESEPVKLIEMVREIKKHFNEKYVIRLPQSLKQKLTNELIEVLRVMNASTNTTLQH
nr:ankyrin repeat domain-containing protein [Tanacetum cinerariifolium]